ncbi:unnamed protein product, partial [Pleuronectes platessa]
MSTKEKHVVFPRFPPTCAQGGHFEKWALNALEEKSPVMDNHSVLNYVADAPNTAMLSFRVQLESGSPKEQRSAAERQTLPTTTYELEIVAKDMAGSEVGLTGTATATITITDKNDHAPEFTHPL